MRGRHCRDSPGGASLSGVSQLQRGLLLSHVPVFVVLAGWGVLIQLVGFAAPVLLGIGLLLSLGSGLLTLLLLVRAVVEAEAAGLKVFAANLLLVAAPLLWMSYGYRVDQWVNAPLRAGVVQAIQSDQLPIIETKPLPPNLAPGAATSITWLNLPWWARHTSEGGIVGVMRSEDDIAVLFLNEYWTPFDRGVLVYRSDGPALTFPPTWRDPDWDRFRIEGLSTTARADDHWFFAPLILCCVPD
jgi:hypothetical protein